MIMNGSLHPKAYVDKLYVSRNDGGRGLRQMDAAYQVVHMEEKLAKKEVLRRIIKLTRRMAQSQGKLKGKWEQKKLHGQYLKEVNASDVNKKSTHNWLRLLRIKPCD